MKIFYRLLLTLIAILAAAPLSAQVEQGKPLYTIFVDRDGSPFGEIGLELFPDIAPLHVRNFDSLVSAGFYDGTAFHRVIPGFVIQGGDPNSRDKPRSTWGTGEPGQQTVPAEFSALSHRRGVLSAARTDDPNSATSQFFIMHGNSLSLDGRYSIYGQVTFGLDIVDSIALAPRDNRDNPFQKFSMRIVRTGIDTTLVAAPQLLLPESGTRNLPTGVSVTWSPVQGAILYEVQVASNQDMTEGVSTYLTPNPAQALTGLKRGLNRYYWRVRASNGGRRGEYSEIRSFITSVLAPVIAEPASGDTAVSKPVTLRWKPVDGATGYRIQLSTRLTYAPLIIDSVEDRDTMLVVEGLEPGTKYYWRVRAIEDTSAGPYSINANFTTDDVSSVDSEDLTGGSTSRLSVITRNDGTAMLSGRVARATSVVVVLGDLNARDIRRVYAGRLDAGEFQLPLDLSGLAAGTYLIRLEGEGVRLGRTVQVGY